MIKAPPLKAVTLCILSPLAFASEEPSYDCSKVTGESIEAMICADAELSALDQKLAEVYTAAQDKSKNERPATLKPEQRGWTKGRDECWKENNKRQCVADSYIQRIAELQALYRLVELTSVVTFACNDNPKDELVVSYFATNPATLIADYDDSVSLMYRQPSTEGMQYQGRNESIAFKADEAVVVWGYEATPMRCTTAR